MHIGYTDIFYKNIFKSKLPFLLMSTKIKKGKKLHYLPATGMAFQREIIKRNEQPPIQGNGNLIDAINIVWIVAWISRTSQNVILY